RVELYTHVDLTMLRREAATKPIHRVEEIAVWRFAPAFLEALEAKTKRNMKLEITRNDGQLYVVVDGTTLETPLVRESLVANDS
ncbi:MAG: YaeQ family protein, partial [Polyangiaceae bacterium]